MSLRNKYIGIISEGKLYPKTWRNPDKFPEDKRDAFEWAERINIREKDEIYKPCAYAVVITQILEEDL